MYVNDIRRMVTRLDRMGLGGRRAYKVPLYLAALIPFDALALAGMYWAMLRPQSAPRRPL